MEMNLGRKDLIDAVALNSFIGQESASKAKENLSKKVSIAETGFYCSVFRGCKMDRLSILGAVVAIETYMKMDHGKTIQKARNKINYLIRELKNIPNIKMIIIDKDSVPENPLQTGLITLIDKTPKETCAIVEELMNGDPEIWPGYQGNTLTIYTTSFRGLKLFADGDEKIIAERIKSILSRASY